MRKMSLAAVSVLVLAASARAQGSAKGELAMAGGTGWDAAGFNRLYDAARAGLPGVVRMPEERFGQAAARSEVKFAVGPDTFVGPRPPSRPLVVPAPVATPQYRHTFEVLLSKPEVTDRYDELILKYAQAYHLDARLLKAVIAAESEFLTAAVSPKGAHGLMQVMPRTAEEMGIPRSRLHEPEFNIAAGAAYIAHLFERAFKKYKLKGVRFHEAPLWLKQRIIAAYNAGPKFLFRDGGWYKQTRDYVRKVLLFYNSRVTDFRRGASSLDSGPRLSVSASTGTLY